MKLRHTVLALSAAGALAAVPAFADQHSASEADAMQGASGQSGAMQQSGQQQADSETIRAVQQALSEQGHDAGPIDGIMGPQTESALEEFQQAQGLDGDGQLNAQTLSALGLEREASEFAAGEVREETGAQEGGGAGSIPSDPGMGGGASPPDSDMGGAPADQSRGSPTESPSGTY